MRMRIFVISTVLLGLGACSSPSPTQTRADSPYYRPPTPAEQTCDSKGFMRGTNAYDECMARATGADKPLPPVVSPAAGVEAFRDEYGFRYDALGNRLDARGNIISPQSTTP